MRHWFLLLLFMLPCCLPVAAQQDMGFEITDFKLDEFSDNHDKKDGDGMFMALLKVVSNNPNEDWSEYKFDFGSLYNEDGIDHGEDGLWLYVQRNAKEVRVRRGNVERSKSLTQVASSGLEPGRVYWLYIRSAMPEVKKQWVEFHISPKNADASVIVSREKRNENKPLGRTDVDGIVSENLEYGTYTYTVMAKGYAETKGRFTLPDTNPGTTSNNNHIENVILRSNTAEITLQVDADADIYIDGRLQGRKTWTGRLEAGNYQVECRMDKHESTMKTIRIESNRDNVIKLDAPTPITGKVSIKSTPRSAIKINGKDEGNTPHDLDLLIGSYIVTLTRPDYKAHTQTLEVKQGETATIDVQLVSNAPSGEKPQTEKRTKPRAKTFKGTGSTGFYAGLFGQAGTMMGGGINIGGYFSKVNLELSAMKGFGKETLYLCSNVPSVRPVEVSYSPSVAIGGKLGYWIKMGKRWGITPQVGMNMLTLSHDGGQDTSANLDAKVVSLTVGARIECTLASHLILGITPEGAFVTGKGGIYKALSDTSSRIKGWGTGAGVRIGLHYVF